MKRRVLAGVIVLALCLSTFNGMFTPAYAASIDIDALNKMGTDLDKLTDAFDSLDIEKIEKMPAEKTAVSDGVVISTNMMIAACGTYTLGLQKNGRVVSTGLSLSGADNVSDWSGITMIAAGMNHSVGLKSDGTVITAGSNADGQCNVSGWRDIIAVSAGAASTLGLKRDGTVVATGDNAYGQLDVESWENITAIAAGFHHSVGLKSDGTVVSIGKNCMGILNTSSWKNIVAISASSNDIMGLDKSSKVYSTKANKNADFPDAIAIATADMYAAGLNRDGTVVTSATDVNVSSWNNIVAIAAGTSHLVGLKSDGTVVSVEQGDETAWRLGQTKVTGWQLAKPAPVTPPAPAAPAVPKSSGGSAAAPTAAKVLVNGLEKAFDAYTIDGNNYFKLRDLAFVLNGTEKQAEVSWDGSKNAINMLTGKSYTPAGGELQKGNGQAKQATLSTAKIYINGQEAPLKAYSINDSNYFKLRDVMQAFNVYVGWDGAKNTISLETAKGY